jgi:hypothetical protein
MLVSPMLVAHIIHSPRPLLRELCALCVKTHLEPRPAISRHLVAKSRRIRASLKPAHNPFRIRSYKKTGEGEGSPLPSAASPHKRPFTPSRGRGATPLRDTHERPQPLSALGFTSQFSGYRGWGYSAQIRRVVTSLHHLFFASPRSRGKLCN